jgi:Helix-turn-helix
MMMTYMQIDWVRFGGDVRKQREKRNLTLKQLQRLIWVCHSTIGRIERGGACGAEVFVTLAWWIEKDPQSYMALPRDFGSGRAFVRELRSVAM